MLRNTRSLRHFLTLVSLLLFGAVSVAAQTPPQTLVSRVKSAVVVVTTFDHQGKQLRQGSGFFIDSHRIVTNYHVIEAAAEVRIKTFNGSTTSVKTILATDQQADLTILQLDSPATDTTSLEVSDVSPAEGETLLVVSNPKGSLWKVTSGQVGATWNFAHPGSRMQITARLAPGSSGGPVVNLRGHLIGIAVMHTGGADDLDFAVPVERLTTLKTASEKTRRQPSAPSN